MIPHIIHYCWFGNNPLPDEALKCIASWKTYCPDYEIKEWNEDNFDLNACSYIKEAYQEKKWAFVSDYARFKILYENGGIYFDTDVELIKRIDDILMEGPFMGIEAGGEKCLVNPGLGIAAEKKDPIYGEIIRYYEKEGFYKKDGTINQMTVVNRVTNILKKHGFTGTGKKEILDGYMTIYPEDFFCPINYYNGKTHITENTRSIHHYSETWHNYAERMIDLIRRKFYDTSLRDGLIEKILIFPFRVLNKFIYLTRK